MRAPACPVCRAPDSQHFIEIEGKTYWRCPACRARFLDPAARLSAEQERAHYELHENALDDPDYRAFLRRLAEPLLAAPPPGPRGLDYGCGPAPALAAILQEAGCVMSLYDPFFAPDPASLSARYDFITCSETAEHFHDPAGEFDRLEALLAPGGVLAVMTCFVLPEADFAAWHYRRDPTHVVFYEAETFRAIARQRGWRCDLPVKDVALLTRP